MKLVDFFETRRYSLAFVELDGFSFALSVRQKGDAYLVKPDKNTRPSDLNTTKSAISAFCTAFCGNIISSNFEQKKIKPKSDKLLDPLYFCSHPEFFDSDIAVEVGFGSGRHLLYRAKEEPNKKFIGIEIYKPSIEQVRRRCELEGIDNVYLVDFDARLLIETMKEGSLSEVYVHFPVPWPDSPTRRVMSERFLRSCSAALRDGGFVELRSDDRDYFEYSFCEAMSLPKSRLEVKKNEPAEIVSKYEDRWLRKGKDIFEMRFYPEKSDISQKREADFSFDGAVDVDVIKNLPKEAMIKDGILVSFDDLLFSKSGNFAVKVTFGDSTRPDSRYIVSMDGKVSYYPFAPLCAEGSITAHKIIKEFLYGKNS